MKSHSMPCTYCTTPVDATNKYSYRRVQGWERAGANGGSDILLREKAEPPEFACLGCVEKMKAGVSVGQGSLV